MVKSTVLVVVLLTTACSGSQTSPPRLAPASPPRDSAAKIDAVRPNGGAAAPAPIMEDLLAVVAETAKAHATEAFALAITIEDAQIAHVGATLGALESSRDSRTRDAHVEVRLADRHSQYSVAVGLPIEDDSVAIRAALREATSNEYRMVLAQSRPVGPEAAELPPAGTYLEPAAATFAIDRSAWETRLRALSSEFRRYPEIVTSHIDVDAIGRSTYVAGTNGGGSQRGRVRIEVSISAETSATDGERFSRRVVLDEKSTDAEIRAAIDRIGTELRAQRTAPIAEHYVGPMLLEPAAAARFLHDGFGQRIQADRISRAFDDELGHAIMPAWIDAYDDPAIASLNGRSLDGFTPSLDRVNLVEHGVLGSVLARYVTNLVFAPSRALDRAALRRALLDEVARQGLPYGYVVRDIDGDAKTNFYRDDLTFMPTALVRVYRDGREELVRGVRLDAMPLESLASIVAMGDDVVATNLVMERRRSFLDRTPTPLSVSCGSTLFKRLEIATTSENRQDMTLLPVPPPGPWTDEVVRSMALELPKRPRPYFVSYNVMTGTRARIEASLGALVSSQFGPARDVVLDLRVGDPAQPDRYRRPFMYPIPLPVDDDAVATRRALWRETEQRYRRLIDLRRSPGEAFPSPPAATGIHPTTPLDRAALEALAKKLSAVFRTHPDLGTSPVIIDAVVGTERFVASNGSDSARTTSSIEILVGYYRLRFAGATLADLPSEATMIARVDALAKALSSAHPVDTNTKIEGPIIFLGDAAGEALRIFDERRPVIIATTHPIDLYTRAVELAKAAKRDSYWVVEYGRFAGIVKRVYLDGHETFVRGAWVVPRREDLAAASFGADGSFLITSSN